MQFVLAVLGLLLWLVAAVLFLAADTAMQEIVAGLIGVSGTVMIVGACIVRAVRSLHPDAVAKARAAAQL